MANVLFKDTTYTVAGLIEDISRGEVALPDIQRPFVWPASKVRDLLDSMYKGFPVGYLLFWETGAEAGTRQIGTDGKETAPRLLIVDGQQRLTSLYAVMTGKPILRADYTEAQIQIAFRPADCTFAVADAAIQRDPEFLPDVSKLWGPHARRSVVREFLARLEVKRELTEAQRDELEEAIDGVFDLTVYPFKAVELGSTVDEEQVAEVFVRINSEGVTLNQADFILTLMSVFWEKGRQELEEFARACKSPSTSGASPFNWYIEPTPAQMLRASVGLAFRRATLKHVYTLLRGKDVETGKSDPDKRQHQFEVLQAAQERALDITNWHEFLQSLERAGYRGSKMISSDTTLMFTYVLWLIGRVDYRVPLDRLRELMARWFFMAHMTGRYSGAFESQFEQDVARLSGIQRDDARAYEETLDKIINDTLTSDFWTITLPNELATSASKSPALLSYIASLNVLDAEALLGRGKVRSRLDPAITSKKGIERHHLFPRAYLRDELGVVNTKEINQIANMALVEWADNIDISDESPATYWPQQIAKKKLSPATIEAQMFAHALPADWHTLEYADFLAQRRVLMGQVVKAAYTQLCDEHYSPTYPSTDAHEMGQPLIEPQDESGFDLTTLDLIEAGVLSPGITLVGKRSGGDAEATLLPNGDVEFDGEVYSSLSAAGREAIDRSVNGWYFWRTMTPQGLRRLRHIRRDYASGLIDSSDDQAND